MWRDDRNAITGYGRTVEQEICELLEFYICECIPYGPPNLRGWWSDGVVCLEIDEIAQDAFKLVGVTWIDSHGLAPFEIDRELNAADDCRFAKTTFRIGTLDNQGHPTLFHSDIDWRCLVADRPQLNRDWAMAVELTPPLSNPSD